MLTIALNVYSTACHRETTKTMHKHFTCINKVLSSHSSWEVLFFPHISLFDIPPWAEIIFTLQAQ
jgi:hypothetical protein